MYEPTSREIYDEAIEQKKWAISHRNGLYFLIIATIAFLLTWYKVVEFSYIVIFFLYTILYSSWLAFGAIYSQVVNIRCDLANLKKQQNAALEHITGLINTVLDEQKAAKPKPRSPF